MLQYSICAFLAPALISAAAFPWAGPEPTLVIPEQDNWSPAPTEAPAAGGLELFRKRDDDNTCGYISGQSTRSLTCNNPTYVCATNTYYGVHGCCDPSNLSTCSIPTTCIPSSQLAASCTGDCSTNDYIAKCTESNLPYCYQWRYIYDSTIMSEFGCASSAFTMSVERTIETDSSSSLPAEASVSDATSTTAASSAATGVALSAAASPTSTNSSSGSGSSKKSSNIGPIVGGVVSGLVVIGAITFGIISLVMRNKKQKRQAQNAASGASQPFIGGSGPAPGVTQYNPHGFGSPQPYEGAAGFYNAQGNEQKWPQQTIYSAQTSPSLQYPGAVLPHHGTLPQGVAEAGGNEVRPPAPQQHVYEAP